MKKEENFDLSPIVANISKVKEMKAAKKKKPVVSTKALQFEISPEDSPLKVEIVKRINQENLTYSDLYNYCTELKGGDAHEGQELGYNIIYGLKTRRSMMDTTFALLCDFLKLDIQLVKREEDDEEE